MLTKSGRWLLGLPIRTLFGGRTLSLRGDGGQSLRFYPSESPRLLLGPSRVDAYLIEEWRQLLGPGEVIVDVGAHIGITVQRFYSILDGKCCILAFEPIARNFALLEENTRFVPPDQLYRFNVALGDKDGNVVFADNLRHGAISRLSVLKPGKESSYWKSVKEVEVAMVRIDSILDTHAVPEPTFFKLDVEGAGGHVLRGATRLLETSKPTFFCEYHTAEETEQITTKLAEAGYRGVEFAGNGRPGWCDPLSAPHYFVHPDHPASKRVASE